MNPSTKLHLVSAGYCALLAGMNWFRSVEYSRKLGLVNESISPIGLSFLLSAAVGLYLVYHCVRSALIRLESGAKVREGRGIESRIVILYALPLLWHRNSSSSWMEPDGVMATATGGYGHSLSVWVFTFAVLGLLLFQILTRLTPDDGERGLAIKL
jgi:hypothetical protein